jgi:hypothetical protein
VPPLGAQLRRRSRRSLSTRRAHSLSAFFVSLTFRICQRNHTRPRHQQIITRGHCCIFTPALAHSSSSQRHPIPSQSPSRLSNSQLPSDLTFIRHATELLHLLCFSFNFAIAASSSHISQLYSLSRRTRFFTIDTSLLSL